MIDTDKRRLWAEPQEQDWAKSPTYGSRDALELIDKGGIAPELSLRERSV